MFVFYDQQQKYECYQKIKETSSKTSVGLVRIYAHRDDTDNERDCRYGKSKDNQ
jgi:hypothetical protein